jgi:uncharacterized protein
MVRRKIRHYLRRLLALDDTPERIALAFAVGVFLAFSPLLGLHTVLGLAIAFLFGLNRVALLIGLFVNNPWTLVPIYAAGAYIGGLILGYPAQTAVPDFGWSELCKTQFWVELGRQWRLLIPVVLGSFILSVFFAILSYPLALYLLKQGRVYRSRWDSTVP